MRSLRRFTRSRDVFSPITKLTASMKLDLPVTTTLQNQLLGQYIVMVHPELEVLLKLAQKSLARMMIIIN